MIVYYCGKQYSTKNSSDNLPSYPPDNHHSSDDVYWVGGGLCTQKAIHKMKKTDSYTVTDHPQWNNYDKIK